MIKFIKRLLEKLKRKPKVEENKKHTKVKLSIIAMFCEINDISRATFYNWRKNNKIKTIKKNKQLYVFIDNEDINLFIKPNLRRWKESITQQLQVIQKITSSLIDSLSRENKE